MTDYANPSHIHLDLEEHTTVVAGPRIPEGMVVAPHTHTHPQMSSLQLTRVAVMRWCMDYKILATSKSAVVVHCINCVIRPCYRR